MDEQTFQRRRLSFGAIADAYDRVRPSYPAEALRWVLDGQHGEVIDLGAGTGLLTQVLVELGHRVTAVDPDPDMRAKLAMRLPGTVVVEGSAERIPMPDGSADAVLAGQAYHWFDAEVAHAEIARVLRPGGIFAPIWNLRDESVTWVAQLSAVDRDGSADGGLLSPNAFGEAFGPVRRRDFQHNQTHTAGTLLALLKSRSTYLAAPPERQRDIEEAFQTIAADLPDSFELPYVTRVYRGVRL